ncbi:5618_t:CDS:2 [Funneliformis geosporum]|uniref:5618_t:CDS:1 n=1 Tax=Funneliformis geosporum TaxID=1117311 RepID=A0A9W4WZF3_9GLOM|nr:5618_t:CDS:2 [Funneliformis geosporum]
MSDSASSSTVNIKTEIVRLVEIQGEKAELLSYFTKHKDQQDDALSDLNCFDTDENKLAYLRTFLKPADTSSLDRVYFFVDNSNVTIEGVYFIRSQKLLDRFLSSNNKIIFDYGLLFKKIRGNRELGGNPVIVCSEISPNDSIHNQGYNVKVLKHNYMGKEKG